MLLSSEGVAVKHHTLSKRETN